MSFQTPLTINEVITKIHAKKYLLPSIQREFVWDTNQIIMLFDSLMRDYPQRISLLGGRERESK